MGKPINAIIQGLDYQALFFWVYALDMFYPYTGVEKVAYEADVKSFDDVVVYYKEDKPFLDCRGNLINIDYFQVKFHVTGNGAFTWENLMDPAFINATKISIMERLRDAQEIYANEELQRRFYLVSPWPIHPDDNLSRIVSNSEGEILVDKLFDGGIRSTMTLMRNEMIDHLGFSNDDELKECLIPFRIWNSCWNTQKIVEIINIKLSALGFKPIENDSIINPYVDLIRQWSRRGISEFTRNFIIEECTREKLYFGIDLSDSEYVEIGIRSFYRRAENMQNETEEMLCLLKFFNERYIKEDYYWNNDIFKELDDFTKELVPSNIYRLHLDTHLSIAFVAGYLLDSKTGIEIYPLQKTMEGKKDWRPTENPDNNYSKLEDDVITLSEDVDDVALVLGLTHDILDDVKEYIENKKISISKIISCTIEGHTGHNAIIDGTHAIKLANSISALLKEKRDTQEKMNKLHIFVACPVGFMFYLGKISRSFGKVVLYEHDFEGLRGGSYLKSFELPINSTFDEI